MVLSEIGIILASCIALVIASNFLVRSLVKISRFAGIGQFATSFVLLAFATSLPELLIGVNSALKGASTLAYSVVIGSNIIDLSFILGLTIILAHKIPVKGIVEKSDTLYMSIIAILLLLLSGDGSVSRMDGIILLVAYAIYVVDLFKQKLYFKAKNTKVSTKAAVLNFFILIVSGVILFISSEFLVNSSLALVTILNIPIVFIGFVIVAVGASFPELIFEIETIIKKKKQLAMGNLMGSVVANSALIIGICAVISPMIFSDMFMISISFLYLLLILLLFNIFMYTKKQLNWWEGAVLILVYLTYLAAQYHLQP